MRTENLTAPERWLAAVPATSGMARGEMHCLSHCEANGTRYVFTTNGHVLIAEPSEREASETRLKGVPKLILARGDAVGRFAGSALLEWAGPAEYPVVGDCEGCYGTGVVAHECSCPLCTEDEEECWLCGGAVVARDPAVRYGIVCDFGFDRNYVAMVVEALGGECEFALSLAMPLYAANSAYRMLMLDPGDGRVGLVMGNRICEGPALAVRSAEAA